MAETLNPGSMNKIFIDVEVDDSIRNNAAIAAKLEEVCPVDIYRDAGGTVEVVAENCDECVLCKLCIEAAPPGTVHVKKIYDGTELSQNVGRQAYGELPNSVGRLQ